MKHEWVKLFGPDTVKCAICDEQINQIDMVINTEVENNRKFNSECPGPLETRLPEREQYSGQ